MTIKQDNVPSYGMLFSGLAFVVLIIVMLVHIGAVVDRLEAQGLCVEQVKP